MYSKPFTPSEKTWVTLRKTSENDWGTSDDFWQFLGKITQKGRFFLCNFGYLMLRMIPSLMPVRRVI